MVRHRVLLSRQERSPPLKRAQSPGCEQAGLVGFLWRKLGHIEREHGILVASSLSGITCPEVTCPTHLWRSASWQASHNEMKWAQTETMSQNKYFLLIG